MNVFSRSFYLASTFVVGVLFVGFSPTASVSAVEPTVLLSWDFDDAKEANA